MKKILSLFAVIISGGIFSIPAFAQGNFFPKIKFLPLSILPIYGVAALIILIAAFIGLFFFNNKKNIIKSAISSNDTLTGLGSKKYLRSAYDENINETNSSLYYFTYIAFDSKKCEREKAKDICDKFQIEAAETINRESGDLDYLARIENGIFILCMRNSDMLHASQKANQIVEELNKTEEEFFGNADYPFRAGIYVLGENKAPLETAMNNSMVAYNHAVQTNVNSCFCTRALLQYESSKDRLASKFAFALNNNQFEAFIQFIYNVKEDRFTGGETLSRWKNPEEGYVLPGHYISDMQKTGMIEKFDYYMLAKCCALLDEWKKEGYDELKLSCNITRITISSEYFIRSFNSIAKKYDFDKKNLILEITEDALIDDQNIAFKNIAQCKKNGYTIALDDFGVGHSSITDLCDYPIDILKIDRYIINKLDNSRGDAVLGGIVKLAHDLGIKVVAEGVETKEQRDIAIKNECDFIQGYLYSYVLPKSEAISYYNKPLEI